MSELRVLSFPGPLLQRGFWLYVWEIQAGDGKFVYYVGRTGDSSSLNAQSPFVRVSGHLGSNKRANALRRHLAGRNIDPSDCRIFTLAAFGPLFAEGKDKLEHDKRRDAVAALEHALCSAMRKSGYDVLNRVHHKRGAVDAAVWDQVRAAFAVRFGSLKS